MNLWYYTYYNFVQNFVVYGRDLFQSLIDFTQPYVVARYFCTKRLFTMEVVLHCMLVAGNHEQLFDMTCEILETYT